MISIISITTLKTQTICEDIPQIIDYWKYKLQASFENFINKYDHERTYSWLSNISPRRLITQNPIDHLQ